MTSYHKVEIRSVLGITASGCHRLPLRQCLGAGVECGLLTLAGAGAAAEHGATTDIDHTNIPRVAAVVCVLGPSHRSTARGVQIKSIHATLLPVPMMCSPHYVTRCGFYNLATYMGIISIFYLPIEN